MFELPSNAQHWITAESRAGAAAVWRRNPAGEVSIMSGSTALVLLLSTREREKYILPGFGLTRNWFSFVNLWKDKASHRKGEGL